MSGGVESSNARSSADGEGGRGTVAGAAGKLRSAIGVGAAGVETSRCCSVEARDLGVAGSCAIFERLGSAITGTAKELGGVKLRAMGTLEARAMGTLEARATATHGACCNRTGESTTVRKRYWWGFGDFKNL